MDDFLLADGLFLQQPAFEQLAIVSVKIKAKAELGKETRGQVTPTRPILERASRKEQQRGKLQLACQGVANQS